MYKHAELLLKGCVGLFNDQQTVFHVLCSLYDRAIWRVLCESQNYIRLLLTYLSALPTQTWMCTTMLAIRFLYTIDMNIAFVRLRNQ